MKNKTNKAFKKQIDNQEKDTKDYSCPSCAEACSHCDVDERVLQTCCGSRGHDSEEALPSCCSSGHDLEEALPSCCSSGHDLEEALPSCCSSGHDLEEALPSCCSSGHDLEEALPSCCSSGHNLEEALPSCCSSGHDLEEALPSCCSSGHDLEEALPSCCSSGHDLEEALPSCCSSGHDLEEALPSCCSSGGSKVETCCGTVDLNKKARKREFILLLVSLFSIVASFIFSKINIYNSMGSQYWSILDPAWIAIAVSGAPLFITAYRKLKKGKITSSLLVSMAMVASIVIGFLTIFGVGDTGHDHGATYFFAAGEVAFIMAIGAYLENLTIGKSQSAIKNLISMKPSLAMRKRLDDTYEQVNISMVMPGDIVLVRPNENISVDGIIVSGNSAVDFSSINGEYLPVECAENDEVYAGTRNMSGALEIRTTKKSDETTLSRLIEYVKEAKKKKAPVERIADKWASYLVVTSLAISVLVFLLGIFAFNLSIMEGVGRAATVLVVFCPCALALATPIAIAAGIGSSSKKGILIKSGSALESLAKVNVIAFDKTGTITEGKLKVEGVYPYKVSEEELLMYAASAEYKSEHPLAQAIIKRYGKPVKPSQNTVSLIGKGVEATILSKKVGVYKIEHIKDIIPEESYKIIPAEGRTVVGVVLEGNYIGAISISDTLRPGIREVIAELKAMGFKTVMLTGDSKGAANKVALEIGIDDVKAGLLPEEKVREIEELKAQGKKVLMIGDGVNDAAALASSDCSLAIGAMGSSVAMETAESSLLSSDMTKIPLLLRLSKRTLATIKINITLSLFISFIAIILSMFGYIDAVIGALIHNGSSTLVCLNSAFLLFYKGQSKNGKQFAK